MNFAFLSTMTVVPWGGSEVLWRNTAIRLMERGHSVHTLTHDHGHVPAPLAELRDQGARITLDRRFATGPDRLLRLVAPDKYRRRIAHRRRTWLTEISSPRLFVSAGSVLDDFSELDDLGSSGIPYAILIHAASPLIWPPDSALPTIDRVLSQARAVYFVSEHNRRDVSTCLGRDLPNASVIRNGPNFPPAVRAAGPLPWPSAEGLSLACVGRLDVAAKGQDLLVAMLAAPKWRERDVAVTFYGEGPHRKALENASRSAGLSSVEFAGQVADVAQIWRKHHAGILPSRYEGMPLVIMESMMLGRPHIATAVCGNPEIIADNVTGFLASDPTVAALDEALERAWQARERLKDMGRLASERMQAFVPADPPATFADVLERDLRDPQ